MTSSTLSSIRTLAMLGIWLAPGAAHALSCMVVGETTAKVQSGSGVESPPFLSESCESLKLVSGKAMVSWIARNGKPHFSPITAEGVSGLPGPGAEERSASMVWSEMTSKREAQRPAFMRALDMERPARAYIPADGLVFPAATCDALSVKLIDGVSETLVYEKKSGEAGPGRVTRQGLVPGALFVVEIKGVTTFERWLLKLIEADEATRIEVQVADIASAGIDAGQQRILEAMLYEQLRLPVNMALTIQEQGASAPVVPDV